MGGRQILRSGRFESLDVGRGLGPCNNLEGTRRDGIPIHEAGRHGRELRDRMQRDDEENRGHRECVALPPVSVHEPEGEERNREA